MPLRRFPDDIDNANDDQLDKLIGDAKVSLEWARFEIERAIAERDRRYEYLRYAWSVKFMRENDLTEIDTHDPHWRMLFLLKHPKEEF